MVQSPDIEANKRFAEDLVQELQGNEYKKYVNFIDYKRDVEFFTKNAMLFMDKDDLEEILARVEDRIAQEKLKLSPKAIHFGHSSSLGQT